MFLEYVVDIEYVFVERKSTMIITESILYLDCNQFYFRYDPHNILNIPESINMNNDFSIYQCLYLAKFVSKQPYETEYSASVKPYPKSTIMILIMLLMCGDTGSLINPGPVNRNIDAESSIIDNIDPDVNHFNDNFVNFNSYSICSIKDKNIFQNNSLNLFHNNSRSILKDGRLDEYGILFDSLNNPFHVITFTETWLKSDNKDNASIKGFQSSHVIRPIDHNFNLKDKGGGISIFVKDGIDYKLRNDMNVTLSHIETLFIELKLNGKKYMIGTVYRVPNTNVNDFNETLNQLIEPVSNDYEVVLLGDFNICLMEENNHTRSFCSMLQSNVLFPVILEPTRVATILRNDEYITTETLIDNIFVNTQLNFNSGLIYSTISDHYPIFISIMSTSVPQNVSNEIKYRLIDDFRIRKFKCAINNSLQHIVEGEADAARAFDKFFELLNNLYNKYFPIKTKIVTNKSLRHPWVTEILVRSIKKREKMSRLAKRGRIDRQVFIEFRNLVTKQLREARANYYNDEFSNCNGNIKKTWNIINKTIKKNNAKTNILIRENDNLCKPDDLPDKFNNYFSNIAEKLVSEIPSTNKSPENYLRNRNPK